MAYFKNKVEDIILGIDIPTYIIDYDNNKNIISTLSKEESIIAGHLMWSIVRVVGIKSFDTKEIEYERDSSFGKILVDINTISGITSPDDYEKSVEEIKLSNEEKQMLSSCYSKIAIAIVHNYQPKIIKG